MWGRMKPKKTYLSIFIYSCIAVSLLTLVFTAFLSQQFARSAMDEMAKSNQEKMKQVVKTSEFTLQKLRQFALRIYSDENIALWLNMEEDDFSPLTLFKAGESVRQFMSSEPFIDSVYLINYNLGQVYTSEASLYTTQEFYDQPMLEYIRGQKTPYLQYFNHEVKGETYLALVVPAAGPNQNYRGFVAILFSKPLLNENMLQISEGDQNKIYIEGKRGEIMLGNTSPALTAELNALDKSDVPKEWEWAYGGETWSIQTVRLPIEGWRVYHLSPTSLWQEKIARIRLEIVGSSVALLLALLLFLFWQSYRSLKPISDLAAQMQGRLGKKHPMAPSANADDDMAWIHSGFRLLQEEIERLDLSIKSSQALVKADFLRQWILNSKSSGPAEAYIRKHTGVLRTGWFRIAVIRLESYGRFEEQYDFASRKLLRYAMGNIAEEVLANHGFLAETVDFSSDHVAALFASAGAEEETAPVVAAMEDIREQIRRWLKLETQAAVSAVLDEEENLQVIYNQVYELTLLGFINGESRVFTPSDLESYEVNEDSAPDEELLKQVIRSVHLKNDKALEGYLDDLTMHMQALDYKECRLQLTHIVYTIMKSFKDDKTFQGMKSIHTFLEQFATIGEVKAWLYRELQQIMDRHRKKNASSRKDEVAAEMIEYVRNHFHNPMLSVDDIAAHVSMSVNYARQVFKERFQCSLSDYITNQRIEYAIKLLTTTDWTVADITEQSGFQTKSTFFSLFKRATGMTPNQYRAENGQAKA